MYTFGNALSRETNPVQICVNERPDKAENEPRIDGLSARMG